MVPAESAHDTIAGLGEIGLLQFKDLSADKSAFQRTYASQVSLSDCCLDVGYEALTKTDGFLVGIRSSAATRWPVSCASSLSR